ncbi:MAG: cysteine desulfurase [Actinomycetota bacterium]|nr:cysteine desulfurase [Actinomycetota bacterium]
MIAYLDHAATTPMVPRAIEAMAEQLASTGNASSLHTAGRAARRVVEESRETLAAAVGARPSEVIFTSGGTESDNLAVKGSFWARRGPGPGGGPARNRILVSEIEHHAVLDSVEWLEQHEGAELTWLPVDQRGRVRVDVLSAEMERDPDQIALVTVMWANNEVGTLQPLDEVVAAARKHGVPTHSDAVQALGHVPLDFAGSGLDLVTLSGHKIGGPVGVGALLARRDAELVPLSHGGGQERGVRSGTVDVASIRAFAVAADVAAHRLSEESARLSALREELVHRVLGVVPDAVLRGDPDPAARLPGNALFTFPGCEGDSLLYLLDAADVQCSTGSACQAGVPQPSHVLLALGVPNDDARGALRFSLGHTSTRADVDALVAALPDAVERARHAGLASRPAAGLDPPPVQTAVG